MDNYRVDTDDSEKLDHVIGTIALALQGLSECHDCRPGGCTFCHVLIDLRRDVESRVREAFGNPISEQDAQDLERFLALV